MGEPRDPVLHTHIEDCLPDEHPLAFSQVRCIACGVLVHAGNNECMQTWVETGMGNFCLNDFAKSTGQVVEDEYALTQTATAETEQPSRE